MRRSVGLLAMVLGMFGGLDDANAVDIPIMGSKLIVVDKIASASKAKAVFVAKDVNVSKGTGTDPMQVEATLDIAYDAVSGQFTMPQGPNWLVNSDSVGKYVNKAAPTDGAVKVSVIKSSSLVKVVGKGLGDTPLDISSPPSGVVYVVDTIVNGGDETRLCTLFFECGHKLIAGDTGYKLVCRLSAPNVTCATATPVTCVTTSATFCGLADGTVYDAATGLQWETKTTPVASGVNGADLHDVDNRYNWAGRCSVTTSKHCQPNLAAETACKAETDAASWGDGCEQCIGGEGTCNVDPLNTGVITTVWDWINLVNAANYAGHNDWRLPSQSACESCFADYPINTCSSCSSHELESLLTAPYVCGTSPCIDPIFGPTVGYYWSGTLRAAQPLAAWAVDFSDGRVDNYDKRESMGVRAVRDGS